MIDPIWRPGARKCRNLRDALEGARGGAGARGAGRGDLRALMQCRRVIDHAAPRANSCSAPPRPAARATPWAPSPGHVYRPLLTLPPTSPASVHSKLLPVLQYSFVCI
ncbi:unnamed protein product [Spodoptera exigua]|nr:unnamed protein product [Spodoptera exigua]